jgi:hypothetical protein
VITFLPLIVAVLFIGDVRIFSVLKVPAVLEALIKEVRWDLRPRVRG